MGHKERERIKMTRYNQMKQSPQVAEEKVSAQRNTRPAGKNEELNILGMNDRSSDSKDKYFSENQYPDFWLGGLRAATNEIPGMGSFRV